MKSKKLKIYLHIFLMKCCGIKLNIILLTAFIATCLLGDCNGVASRTTALDISQAPHECESLDIRNECSNFQLLENCTVIKGYLMIVLLPKDKAFTNGSDDCNWAALKFPLLREITDYLIFFHVKGLKTLKNMFPNLTVIRGERLFLNYALGISGMPDLERIEFRSLIAVQRGHIYIGSSNKLCEMERINWDRLTLTTGENHIFPGAPEACKYKARCLGCDSQYCWSNRVCQKFENDKAFYTLRDTSNCDEQCLGGCIKSPTDCVVCRGLTDHGKCVKQCPPNKLLHEHSQRCYTHDECINHMGLFRHQDTCVSHCPSRYKANENKTCIRCTEDETCVNVCQPEPYTEDFIPIYNLADADRIAGCEVINSTLMIIIRNKINENDLVKKLSNIREIRGHLKVFRSPYLTSLKFLSNLEKISGIPCESGHYSLVVYGNKNLKELWKPKRFFELERGGMYIHFNNKLCNHNLIDFSRSVIHDRDMDSIQQSDQEVLCGPIKLLLDIQVLSHRQLLFSWPKEYTFEKIEIMYRPVSKSELFNDETELDTPVCERINWRRELIVNDEINDNGTHVSYAVDGLSQNTKYACLVKTFGSSYAHAARSDLVFMTTKADIPPPPEIQILKKTNVSLTIRLGSNNNSDWDYMVDHYFLEVYEKPDNVHYLDERNYCQNPAYLTKNLLTEAYSNSIYDEDFDDCCARLENSFEDERFMAEIESEFSCSLDRKERCVSENTASDTGSEKPIRNLRLLSNQSHFELEFLKPFRLYVLMLKACNMIGCSSFSMHSERTNYTAKADMVRGLEGCRMPNSAEYRVFFTEPKNPNGGIVSFVVHLRRFLPNAKHYQTHIGCVTRLEHENAKNVFVRHLNFTYNQVAVRAHSLAGDTITNWLRINPCDAAVIGSSIKLAGFGNNNKKMSAPHGSKRSLNIFLIFFLIGCAGTAMWVCYKRRYWRRLPELRQYFTMNQARISHVLIEREESPTAEDRQILVDNFETVRFHNRPYDDDDNYTIVSNISN